MRPAQLSPFLPLQDSSLVSERLPPTQHKHVYNTTMYKPDISYAAIKHQTYSKAHEKISLSKSAKKHQLCQEQ